MVKMLNAVSGGLGFSSVPKAERSRAHWAEASGLASAIETQATVRAPLPGPGAFRWCADNGEQAQPDVASPTAPSATVARKAAAALKDRRRTRLFFVAFMVTSRCVVVGTAISEIQLPARPQPKASANSNA